MKRLTALMFVLMFGLAACEEDGPAERFGENMDEAADELGDAARDTGDDIEDTFDR